QTITSKESEDIFRLNFAIDKYKKGQQYDVAFSIFKDLMKDQYYSNSNDESKIKIYNQATYYSALCYLYEHGVEQDKAYALDITDNLHNSEDVWDIYQELIEDDEIKLTALIKIASCYNKKIIQSESLAFKIALELYSKNKYKESYEIFSKLSSSKNDVIKFLATCFKASYYISGYNNIKKDKNHATMLLGASLK
ncbi:7685_t:CDS:1, partial [Racocetra persica]